MSFAQQQLTAIPTNQKGQSYVICKRRKQNQKVSNQTAKRKKKREQLTWLESDRNDGGNPAKQCDRCTALPR